MFDWFSHEVIVYLFTDSMQRESQLNYIAKNIFKTFYRVAKFWPILAQYCLRRANVVIKALSKDVASICPRIGPRAQATLG